MKQRTMMLIVTTMLLVGLLMAPAGALAAESEENSGSDGVGIAVIMIGLTAVGAVGTYYIANSRPTDTSIESTDE